MLDLIDLKGGGGGGVMELSSDDSINTVETEQ